MMKQTRYYIKEILAACCLIFLGTACQKEQASPWNGETSTLRLNIPTLETKSRAAGETEPGTPAEDKINTLRILIADKNNEPIHNRKYTAEEMQTGAITIEKIPVGFVQIYAIANEESLGKDYSVWETWQNSIVTEGEKKKILFIDEADPKKFPLRGSQFTETVGLPMTWENKALEILPQKSDAPQEVTVELERAVAKINLLVSHGYDASISITEVSFGPFMGDRFYLFKEKDALFPEVPSDAVYSPEVYSGLSIALPSKTVTRTLTLYVYPSFAWKSGYPEPYTLGFVSSVGEYPAKPIVDAQKLPIRQLKRNTILNIKVFISETNLSFDYKVEDWETATVDVPEFE